MSESQPMGDGIVGNESAIEGDGFAIEDVGEGFVGRSRIAERAGGQREAATKSSFNWPSTPKRTRMRARLRS